MQCKLGTKKKSCPNEKDDPIYCWRDGCEGWMHEKCCGMLLARYEIPLAERPKEEDRVPPDNLPVVFCTKTCYLKWKVEKNKQVKAAKKLEAGEQPKRGNVPWKEDGSLDVLMDWLTTHGNYAKYCGANGNKGKTKTAYHKDIALLIKEKKPQSERTEKDVANKIQSLESQFRVATDWINNTGQGVEDPGDFEAAVLKRCALYRELEPIMLDRPNAAPLATNEGPVGEDSEEGEDRAEAAPTAVQQSTTTILNLSDSDSDKETPWKKTAADTPSTGNSGSSSISTGSKRITAGNDKKPKRPKKMTPDEFISSYMGGDSEDDTTSFRSLRTREVQAREKEASARWLEATASSEKTKKETAILNIDERVKLIRERHKLIAEGICTEDNIDDFLPLRKTT